MAYCSHRNEQWFYLWQCKRKFRLLPLALENLTQSADSHKTNQQSNKWEDTKSLLPLKDFNTILKQSATDELGRLIICVYTHQIYWLEKKNKKIAWYRCVCFVSVWNTSLHGTKILDVNCQHSSHKLFTVDNFTGSHTKNKWHTWNTLQHNMSQKRDASSNKITDGLLNTVWLDP